MDNLKRGVGVAFYILQFLAYIIFGKIISLGSCIFFGMWISLGVVILWKDYIQMKKDFYGRWNNFN